MELIAGRWVETDEGKWLNMAHCDLIEVAEAAQAGEWRVMAWSAHQSQADAVLLARCSTEAAARETVHDLLRRLAEVTAS